MISGLGLAIAGAILDFYSGSIFFSISVSTTSTMMGATTIHHSVAAEGWGIFLVALGVLLVLTAVLNLIASFGMKHMALFGILMMGYGAVMLVVGALMYFGVTPMMSQQYYIVLVSSFGMFAIGALMVVNGALMVRRKGMVMPVPLR